MNDALRPVHASLLAALLLAGACRPDAGTEAGMGAVVVASFRGDAAHHGVYESRPVRRRPAVRWRFVTEGPVRSSPAIAGPLVVFGSGDGNLYAVDAASGRLAWKVATGGAVDSSPAVAGAMPAIAGGTVFFASRDRKVYAVDLATGAPRWSVPLGADLPFEWGYDYFLSSPVVDGDGLLIGGGDGVLYRLSARTGALLWRLATGARIRSSPAVAGGVAYVGGMDGRLYAVDARRGRLRWTFATDGAAIDSERAGYDRRSINSSPAVDAGVVAFGSRDDHLYAVDAATGRLLWKVPHPVARFPGHPEVSWVEGSPVLAAGTAYVGASDGRVVEARELATGRARWSFPTPSLANASPSLAGGVLYAGCGDGGLYALDAASGRLLWRFATGDAVYSSPAVASGVVYFGSDDGALYAVSDVDAAGHPVPERAVYFDERAGGLLYEDAKLLADALARDGYTPLDAAGLADFFRARIADRLPSAVVFATDAPPAATIAEAAAAIGKPPPAAVTVGKAPPPAAAVGKASPPAVTIGEPPPAAVTVAEAPPSATTTKKPPPQATIGNAPPAAIRNPPCLLRRYLDAGGRIVWPGMPPFFLALDASGKPVRTPPGTMRRVLGVATPGFTAADGELRRSAATPAGREWGLPAWAIYAFPVAPGAVTTVLARDPAGRATAWVERFGEGGRGAFVRFWGRDRALPAAATAEALAEHGLQSRAVGARPLGPTL